MKDILAYTLQKLLLFKKFFFGWTKEIEGDISFYIKNTELFAIWTLLYMTLAGLFFLAVQSKILVILLLFALSIIITLTIVFFTVYYLHNIKYGSKKQLLPRLHNLSNKSFKLRYLLNFIRKLVIPPLVSFIRTLMHLIKGNFKLIIPKP